MAEGRTYQCTWKLSGKTYAAWVTRRRFLAATGKSFQEAIDKLCAVICHHNGDGEPDLLFDPPRPLPEESRVSQSDDWVLISPGWGDGECRGLFEEHFRGGICKGCGGPIGKRTDVPLEFVKGPRNDVESALWQNQTMGHYDPPVVSDRFLALLTKREQAACEWRPVVAIPRMRRKYFECIPKVFVPFVAVRGMCTAARECAECAARDVRSSPTREGLASFEDLTEWMSESDLNSAREPIIGAGRLATGSLVLRSGRARELARHAHGKGIDLRGLGVVSQARVDPKPTIVKYRHKR